MVPRAEWALPPRRPQLKRGNQHTRMAPAEVGCPKAPQVLPGETASPPMNTHGNFIKSLLKSCDQLRSFHLNCFTAAAPAGELRCCAAGIPDYLGCGRRPLDTNQNAGFPTRGEPRAATRHAEALLRTWSIP